MARRKPANTVHLRLRFPERLRRRIEVAAVKNQRSMNLEIVDRLDRSFLRDDDAERSREIAVEVAEATFNRLAALVGHAKTEWEADRLTELASAAEEELWAEQQRAMEAAGWQIMTPAEMAEWEAKQLEDRSAEQQRAMEAAGWRRMTPAEIAEREAKQSAEIAEWEARLKGHPHPTATSTSGQNEPPEDDKNKC
jgi:hypothetical protein